MLLNLLSEYCILRMTGKFSVAGGWSVNCEKTSRVGFRDPIHSLCPFAYGCERERQADGEKTWDQINPRCDRLRKQK